MLSNKTQRTTCRGSPPSTGGMGGAHRALRQHLALQRIEQAGIQDISQHRGVRLQNFDISIASLCTCLISNG